jgi:hypothetical protein
VRCLDRDCPDRQAARFSDVPLLSLGHAEFALKRKLPRFPVRVWLARTDRGARTAEPTRNTVGLAISRVPLQTSIVQRLGRTPAVPAEVNLNLPMPTLHIILMPLQDSL